MKNHQLEITNQTVLNLKNLGVAIVLSQENVSHARDVARVWPTCNPAFETEISAEMLLQDLEKVCDMLRSHCGYVKSRTGYYRMSSENAGPINLYGASGLKTGESCVNGRDNCDPYGVKIGEEG